MKPNNLKNKENEIIKLLENDKNNSVEVLNFLNLFYLLADKVFNLNYYPIFESVYLEKANVFKWKLAEKCNVSERTFFRYEHVILDSFDICLNNLFRDEIAKLKK